VLISGLINFFFYKIFNINLSVNEGISLSAINTIGNLLPLSGGMLAKGIYLKKKHKLSFGLYISTTIALFLIFLSINGIIALISFFILNFYSPNLSNTIIFYTCFILMSCSFLLFFLKTFKRFKHLDNGFSCIKKKPKIILNIIFLQILNSIIASVRLFIIFNIFSQKVNILHCLLYSAVAIIAQFISIIPAGIGVKEGLIGLIGYNFGFSFAISSLVVMVERILMICISFIVIAIIQINFNLKKIYIHKKGKD
jgi:uncharacterized membrane protein YbhN (UPF0104 family)